VMSFAKFSIGKQVGKKLCNLSEFGLNLNLKINQG
jgi:hypothetical protein